VKCPPHAELRYALLGEGDRSLHIVLVHQSRRCTPKPSQRVINLLRSLWFFVHWPPLTPRLTSDCVSAHYRSTQRRLRAFEEGQRTSLDAVTKRLEHSSSERYILGAFEGDTLNGILSFRRWEGLKIQHRASIGGTYLPPESHGRGVGKALLGDRH
jgi:GNAT superfamily N-acetyltransferase